MYLIIVVLFSLFLGALGARIWQQIELVNDSVTFFYHAQRNELLLEGLLSYGVAIFSSDNSVREIAGREGGYVLVIPWPRDGDGSGTIRIKKRGEGIYDVRVIVLRDGKAVARREAELFYDSGELRLGVRRHR